jgi:hypothetical protein
MNTACIICGKPGQICNQCKNLRYCSNACRTFDQPIHELLCTEFTRFSATTRPTPDHIRAIEFPETGAKPRFIWLRLEHGSHETGSEHRSSNASSQVLMPQGYDRYTDILANGILKRKMRYPIRLCFRDADTPGGKLNESISTIIATKRGLLHGFRGPCIAFGIGRFDENGAPTRDLSMTDFRHVADCLIYTVTVVANKARAHARNTVKQKTTSSNESLELKPQDADKEVDKTLPNQVTPEISETGVTEPVWASPPDPSPPSTMGLCLLLLIPLAIGLLRIL